MKKRLKNLSLSKLTFILIITTIIVTELTLSQYSTTLSRQEEAVIAIMGSDVSLNIVTPQDIYPGSAPAVIPIILTNKENNKVCDVSQEFSLSLERSELENIPFEYALYEDSNCTKVLETNQAGEYVNSDFSFKAGIEDSITYYLKLTWPEEYNQENYAFEIDYIKVKVKTSQLD